MKQQQQQQQQQRRKIRLKRSNYVLTKSLFLIAIVCQIVSSSAAGFYTNSPRCCYQRQQKKIRKNIIKQRNVEKWSYKQNQPKYSSSHLTTTTTTTTILSSSSSSEDDTNTNNNNDRVSGLLVAASVPIAWGTYSPVVKYLYQVQPVVPGIVFSAAYYIVASIVLNTILQIQIIQQKSNNNNNNNNEEIIITDTNDQQQQQQQSSSSSSEEEEEEFPIRGGIELGLYLFIANALQVTGLETVQADRAGFLVQLTTIIVPFLQAALNNKNFKSISLPTWIACLLAFVGVLIMGLDGKDIIGDNNTNFVEVWQQALSLSQGDMLIISAAVLYSFHVVRLGRYAKETTPLKLATSKSNTEAFLSVALVSYLLLLLQQQGGNNNGSSTTAEEVSTFVRELYSGIQDSSITLYTLTPAIGAVLWTGIVTCAYTIFAQSYGQARISPTEANLLYTIQPLYTALFGFVLLGEKLGRAGIIGAILIATAVGIVCKEETEENENNNNNTIIIMNDDNDNDDNDSKGNNNKDNNNASRTEESLRKKKIMELLETK